MASSKKLPSHVVGPGRLGSALAANLHRAGWQGPKATSQVPYAWFVWSRAHNGRTSIDRIAWTADEAAAIRALAREAERPPIAANQFELALTGEVAP